MKITLRNADHPTDKLNKSVIDILRSNELCSMATVTPEGESYIHTAYFCFNEDLDIFFVSDPTTYHGQNIAKSRSMAVAVAATNQPWDQPHRGLQLFGECSMASLAESAKAFTIHAARFHAYGEYIKALNPLELKALRFKFYVCRPNRIKIFDEPQFGEEVFVTATVERK